MYYLIIGGIIFWLIHRYRRKKAISSNTDIKDTTDFPSSRNTDQGTQDTPHKKAEYQAIQTDKGLQEKIRALRAIISKLEDNVSRGRQDFADKAYKIEYQKELNPNQLEAITTIQGKTLIIAGAGSGKTKTLTYRASFLLENHIRAEQILILTFTKKAAGEIKKRVNELLSGNIAKNITSGTFHAFCNMLLARHSKILGINPKFTILDTADSADLLDLLKKQGGIQKKKEVPFPDKSILQKIISSSRNTKTPIKVLLERDHPNFQRHLSEIEGLFQKYSDYKRKHNFYDYDDLIEATKHYLETNPRFRDSIHQRYQHIMVDEYQDTNIPQKEFINLLAEGESCSLMVVGDDMQSIYGFRGANYENILRFGETYRDAKLIKLEQNYRSSTKILDFINEISAQITLGYKKALYSAEKNTGRKPEFIHFTDEEQEAQWITDKIIEAKERLKYKEIAILCRNSASSNFIQAEFLKRHIPFIVIGGIKFLEKRHIKDILAYFKIIWNPLDTISWHRVLTLFRGIGQVTAHRITKDIQDSGGDLRPLKKSSYVKRNEDIELLYHTLSSASEASYLLTIFNIIEQYYTSVLKNIEGDWQDRIADFKVLKRLCGEYKDIEDLLSNLALEPPNNSKAVFTSAEPNEDSVTISTIHSAKGLEWNTVFVIALIDGVLPHYKSFKDYEQLEEERKLFYVACSRAKESLYVTAPRYLTSHTAYFDKASRFINEIDKEKYLYYDSDDIKASHKEKNPTFTYKSITREIKVRKSGQKGKLAFLDTKGKPCSTEAAFQDDAEQQGWHVMRAEVSFWQAMFCLTFWDEIFEGMGLPDQEQDIPHDLFSNEDFYLNRKEAIDRRYKQLLSINLPNFIKQQIKRATGFWTRLLYDGDYDMLAYARSEIVQAFIQRIDPKIYAKIVYRIAKNPNEHRAGIADFVIWNDKELRIVEVKRLGEQVRKSQESWLSWMFDAKIPIEIIRVKAT